MRIYISIPISGRDLAAQQCVAALAAQRLELKGHEPVNPFSVEAPEHLSEKEQYAYCMGEDMKLLLACDAILMVDRQWPKSKGCSIEHSAACATGMEVFYDIYDVPNGDRGKENN